MPLIGSANLGTPAHLRAMVSPGHAQFAGVCRMSMDDPEYANKISEDRENELRLSTRTGASLLQGNIFGKGWAGSAQNPCFGRDREYRVVPTVRVRNIVVVGGGSGGMEYAITAKQAGHNVILLEKSQRLGGTMDWAGNYQQVPNMEMIRYQPTYHRAMMEREGVAYRLGIEANLDIILAEKPDVVVIATGARFVLPQAEGLSQAAQNGFAVTIQRAMSREEAFEPGRLPIIYGAGMGAELAVDYVMRGLRVKLLDPASQYVPANYLGSRGPRVAALLALHRIEFEASLTLTRVGNGSIDCLDGSGETRNFTCDRLIVAIVRQPADELVPALRSHKIRVQVIGDAREPRSYGNAIHEAAYLSRRG